MVAIIIKNILFYKYDVQNIQRGPKFQQTKRIWPQSSAQWHIPLREINHIFWIQRGGIRQSKGSTRGIRGGPALWGPDAGDYEAAELREMQKVHPKRLLLELITSLSPPPESFGLHPAYLLHDYQHFDPLNPMVFQHPRHQSQK